MGEVEGDLDFVSAYFLQKQRITMNNEHRGLYFSRHPPVSSVHTMPMCPVLCIVPTIWYLLCPGLISSHQQLCSNNLNNAVTQQCHVLLSTLLHSGLCKINCQVHPPRLHYRCLIVWLTFNYMYQDGLFQYLIIWVEAGAAHNTAAALLLQ